MNASTTTTPSSISPSDLAARAAAGGPVHLIDVRTPAEFRSVHAKGAVNHPLDALDPEAIRSTRATRAALKAGEPLYVICAGGMRSQRACEQLRAEGLEQVVNVEGGTTAWNAAGLPVEKSEGSKAVMSLMRQVRIAAGSFVAIGSLIGLLIHPAGIFLALFVGLGLIFSGVTDTCAMGDLLAKMPWNR